MLLRRGCGNPALITYPHGFETDTDNLNVVWFIAPPGLEEFFRETRVPPGTPLRNLTPEQMETIGLKHDLEKKPE